MSERSSDELRKENEKLRHRVGALERRIVALGGSVNDVERSLFEDESFALESSEAATAELRNAVCSGMSASTAALALAPNVSLEYTRDSPMFRRSAEAYESALDGLDGMLRELCDRCRAWTVAQKHADNQGRRVSSWLRDRRHARALFSSARGALPEGTTACGRFADDLDTLTKSRDTFASEISAMAEKLDKFRIHEVGDVAEFRSRVWKLGEAYESRLADVLRLTSRDDSSTKKLEDARAKFETARFALVRHLNAIDARKNVVISEAFSDARDKALAEYYRRGVAHLSASILPTRDVTLRALTHEKSRASLDDALWTRVLDRLEAELHGELPPPGAPGNARSPDGPRTPVDADGEKRRIASSAPPWSAALNTEVLSSATLAASRSDLAHVRDEGILKQGYLHRRDVDGFSGLVETLANKTRRKWCRLHNGSLFVVEESAERRLCDLRGCAVHRGLHHRKSALQPNTGGVLSGSFAFAIVRPDGHKLAFQAENDDELIKWISALRRSTKWRELGGSARSIPDKHRNDDDLSKLASLAVDIRNAKLVAQLALANPHCAECDSQHPEWVATAVGVVVCADCAALHRKLGADFSKLRALWLDKWSPLMLGYLQRSAGNEVANEIWEKSPPNGWLKPKPTDSAHVKEEWIVAKYAWYGFIGDKVDQKPATPATDAASRDLGAAALQGDVLGLMRAFSRRGSVTWKDPQNRMRSALHVAALAGHADAVAFLLLNGGDAHQHDADNATPLSLASASESAVAIAQLILEHEQGELW